MAVEVGTFRSIEESQLFHMGIIYAKTSFPWAKHHLQEWH